MRKLIVVIFTAVASISQVAFTRGMDLDKYKSKAGTGISARDGTGTCMSRTGL